MRTSMKPWAETSAGAEPTRGFGRPFTELPCWRVNGGRNERSSSGESAGIHSNGSGCRRRASGEFVRAAAWRTTRCFGSRRKGVRAQCVCAHRERRERDRHLGPLGNGPGNLHLLADAHKRIERELLFFCCQNIAWSARQRRVQTHQKPSADSGSRSNEFPPTHHCWSAHFVLRSPASTAAL